MKFRRFLIAAALLTTIGEASLAIDLRYPPKPAEVAALVEPGWDQAAEALGKILTEGYRPGMSGQSGSTGSPGYAGWLGVWKWCDALSRNEDEHALALLRRHLFHHNEEVTFLPPGFARDDSFRELTPEEAAVFLNDPRARAELLSRLLPSGLPTPAAQPLSARFEQSQLLAWVTDPVLTDLVFRTVVPDDYFPGVLANLSEMAKSDPAGFESYPALATAIAVVSDQRAPEFWPHHQVRRELVPLAETSVSAKFASWLAASKRNELWIDLAKASPSQLKFAVDAPLSESEFAWARKNIRFPRTDFAKAFSAVEYRDDRLKAGELVWEKGDYTLESILKSGGICVDQAYFAAVAGKSRGLPTLFFTGQGNNGGHAWFGYMKPGGRWDLECGRYENQNFVVGHALDPQSWRPITDHELTSIADGFRESRAFRAAEDDLILARFFEKRGEQELAARAYGGAVTVAPQNPAVYDAMAHFLERTRAPLPRRIALHEQAAKTFTTDRDLKANHLAKAAALHREAGNSGAADKISRQIVSQNRHSRSDISVSEGASRIFSMLDAGNSQDALREYRKLLAGAGGETGGQFFYKVVSPLVTRLRASNHGSEAETVIKLARTQLHPTKDSILDRAFAQLEQGRGQD